MANNSLRVVETDRFKQEARELLALSPGNPVEGLIWALRRNPYFGQRVKGSDRMVAVAYRQDFAYLIYYVVSEGTVTLESVLQRKTPIAPGPLGIET